ncbi:MAG TPA: hypothetical protein VM674_02015 [Candidatus Acidoferrum sp.]|nr:hypothetical protein [Candidatus Acidoferrum sp.]
MPRPKPEPQPGGRGEQRVHPPPDETFSQVLKGFGGLVERLTPWLLDLGSWIFGALIAFNLLILASLLTVGPVDAAVLIATLAIALALPPAVAGFFVLRLVEDVKKVRFEDMAAQAFREAGLRVEDQFPPPEAIEALLKQRTKTVLIYSYSILSLSVLFTVAGITAALWHMGWWISLVFLVMTIVSGGAVISAMAGWPSARRKVSR